MNKNVIISVITSMFQMLAMLVRNNNPSLAVEIEKITNGFLMILDGVISIVIPDKK